MNAAPIVDSPLALQGVTVRGDLRGALFEACVEQRFVNPRDVHAEVVYTFPLPWGAVLLEVEAELGGRRLAAAVVARQQADATYEDAVEAGDAAVLLEMDTDGSVTANLGNLAPHETCTVRLRFAMALRFEDGSLRLMLPTTIAPHYDNGGAARPHAPNASPEHSLSAEYPFDVQLTLHGALAQAEVASPSHAVRCVRDRSGDGKDGADAIVQQVSLQRTGALDRDLVLIIATRDDQPLAVTAIDPTEPELMVVMATLCPRIERKLSFWRAEPALRVKVLVDCSGSMNGDSLDAARDALQALIAALKPDDRLSLSRFGSQVQHAPGGLAALTGPAREHAQKWAAGLQADLGGTEMQRALLSTFALSGGESSDLLLITDGEITAIDATVDAARDSGHRVFVVGIGSSPAQALLRQLADETGGACEFVAPGEAVASAIGRMAARLRAPHLTDIACAASDTDPVWIAPLPRAVYSGDTVTVYAVVPRTARGTLALTGRRGDAGKPVTLGQVAIDEVLQPADTVARLAAAIRIAESLASSSAVRAGATPLGRDTATAMAVAHRLVTPLTSAVLVDVREVKSDGLPERVQVAQMLAAGWGGVGSVVVSALRIGMGAIDDCSIAPNHSGASLAYDLCVDSFLEPDGAPAHRSDSTAPRNTPLSWSRWLRESPEADAIESFVDLENAGLSEKVVAALRRLLAAAIADGGAIGQATERDVVRWFLQVLASDSMHGRLTKRESGNAPEFAESCLAEMEGEVARWLVGATSRRWPGNR